MSIRPSRVRARTIALILGVTAVAFPLGAFASHQFTDVPDSYTFHGDIDAIRDAGVTTGCSPTLYCPEDNVTRGQMAAFLNRLGALGPGKTPVVNADRIDGLDSSDLMLPEDILTYHFGDWQANGTSFGSSLVRFTTVTRITSPGSGADSVQLAVDAPRLLGGHVWGIKDVRVCFNATSNAATLEGLDLLSVNTAGTLTNVISDNGTYALGSDRCVTITDATPNAIGGGINVFAEFAFSAAASAEITQTRITWTVLDDLVLVGEDEESGGSESGPGAPED